MAPSLSAIRLPSLASVAVVGVLIISTACSASRERPAQPAPPITTAVSTSAALSAVGVREYIRQSSSIALLTIRASEMALRRSDRGDVRTTAEKLLRDHKSLSAQLAYAGRRLDVLPSATLLPIHATMLTSLNSTRSFDAAFIAQQRDLCRTNLQLQHRILANDSSPTLRPVARHAATVVGAECRRLESLR